MAFVNGFDVPERLRHVDEDDLLGGCMVSPVFGLEGDSEDFDHVFEWGDLTCSVWADGEYEVVGCVDFEPGCVVVRKDGETVGFYMDGQAWVEPDHRRKGLGTAMILSFLALHDRLPNTRGIGFSEEGYALHCRVLEALASLYQDARAGAPSRGSS